MIIETHRHSLKDSFGADRKERVMEDNTVNISDIIKALKVIKSECSKHTNCSNCAFYLSDRCNIKYTDPEYWELESSYIWRAFK